jgi:hypothetical protein
VTVEKLGVPTVPIITDTFETPVEKSVFAKGMPNLRFTFVPHPVAYRPAGECREKILGNDPVTGQPVIREIIEALTKPLTEAEKKTGTLERPRERLVQPPDTPDNLQALFRDNGWTAYMPIILPTEEKVAGMLKGTSHSPDEKVGEMQPSSPHEKWSYAVEQVAVNAVMAGAKPEFFPVILALASIGATSLFTSTNSFTQMVCVNGPIRHEIKMNMSIGALGPFNHANASIGCCWTLISKNLGGGVVPGQNYMGSQGQGHNYNNLCFAEKEERLPPGWNPFHVQKGFRREESVVSVFTGWSWSNMGGFEPNKDLTIKRFFTNNTQCCDATMVLDPLVAMMLQKDLGYQSKEQLSQWLLDNVKTNQQEYWGLPGISEGHPEELEQARARVEPYASWLKLPEGAVIPVPRTKAGPGFITLRDVNIMVAGGETNPYWQGGTLRYVASASVDKWR